jgi:NTE family protein
VGTVGLVLGGGGITGASYHFGALMALRMATGWDPDKAEVIIGTSSGAFVAAIVRGGQLSLDAMLGPATSNAEMTEWLRTVVYRRGSPRGVVRWLRTGLLPGITRPSLGLVLGSPGLYRTDGIEEWLSEVIGPLADTWPDRPTVLVAYDLEDRKRVPFGTEAAPDVPFRAAVAASSAVPFVYEPVRIGDRWYIDGGVASGTSADLLLANPTPLDLIIVIAPMAAEEQRERAWFHERVFDRVGGAALARELAEIERAWPQTDVIVLEPTPQVLSAMRPNPLDPKGAVPTFIRTLISMRRRLAEPALWSVLSHHLVDHSLQAKTS